MPSFPRIMIAIIVVSKVWRCFESSALSWGICSVGAHPTHPTDPFPPHSPHSRIPKPRCFVSSAHRTLASTSSNCHTCLLRQSEHRMLGSLVTLVILIQEVTVPGSADRIPGCKVLRNRHWHIQRHISMEHSQFRTLPLCTEDVPAFAFAKCKFSKCFRPQNSPLLSGVVTFPELSLWLANSYCCCWFR